MLFPRLCSFIQWGIKSTHGSKAECSQSIADCNSTCSENCGNLNRVSASDPVFSYRQKKKKKKNTKKRNNETTNEITSIRTLLILFLYFLFFHANLIFGLKGKNGSMRLSVHVSLEMLKCLVYILMKLP